jgi:hypothetical protein
MTGSGIIEREDIMNASILRRPATLSCSRVPLPPDVRLLVSSTNNETRSGKYVADSTFDQIKPGKTSRRG